ncbi:hypothetical protein [Shewanella sp. GD04112]|uniref:hypothetical protein n=1 Tax=Shewanella sp. GD04112 TaxID=2975434 RepID=UPI00244928F4|nr:hypothetical protein [Shewanella sp. GD04112]MDH0447247.1 hypothetical protein [Shewanella sp. GD04112]
MILQQYERYLLECNFGVRKHPDDAPDFNFERILPNLKNMVAKNQALYEIKNGDVSLRLHKLKVEEYAVTMLFQYADKKATDPTFTEIITGKTRTAEKKEGEGISVSAHLVIRREPHNKALKIFHHAILEEVPGITRQVIANGLTHMLSICAQSTYRRDGEQKDLKCRPMISLEFNGNEKLSTLLNKGTIRGFVAFRDAVDNKMDEDSEFTVKDERITLVALKTRGEKALKMIEEAKGWVNKREYTRLQIKYVGDNRRHRTLEVGVRERDIAEKMFAKSSLVSLNDPIAQCQEDIHTKLHQKIVAKLEEMVQVDV